MPFLKHCRSKRRASDLVRDVLAPLLDDPEATRGMPEGCISVEAAKGALNNHPGFALAPAERVRGQTVREGGTFDAVFKWLEEHYKQIRYDGENRIYIEKEYRTKK